MGQQQLLLLVLGIVIVGIAILVGINAYSENSVKTNWDSLLQDALRIANDAQAWKAKPALFGGSPDDTKDDENDFVGLDFLQLAYSPDLVIPLGAGLECYQNVNGLYQMVPSADGLTIEGQSMSNQNQVHIDVDGNLESDVALDWDNSSRGGVDSSGSVTPVTAFTCG